MACDPVEPPAVISIRNSAVSGATRRSASPTTAIPSIGWVWVRLPYAGIIFFLSSLWLFSEAAGRPAPPGAGLLVEDAGGVPPASARCCLTADMPGFHG